MLIAATVATVAIVDLNYPIYRELQLSHSSVAMGVSATLDLKYRKPVCPSRHSTRQL